MTSPFAVPFTLLESTPPELLFDLVASAEPTKTSYKKRPIIEGNEPVEKNVHTKLLVDEEFELALRASRHEEEMG